MKHIICITGTRPQLIKHAVLTKALQQQFKVTSLYTGQHYSYELYEELKNELIGEQPFHDLKLDHTTPAERLGEMIIKTASFLNAEKPNGVLVYGDTDSTLAAALAATKSNIVLIHVEAGERSFNSTMPEEHNRIITDKLAEVLFCASHIAMRHLEQEQLHLKALYTGDLMKDLLLQTAPLFQTPILNEKYIYCTIHRNYTKHNKAKLQELLNVLALLPHTVIFPVHPATQQTLKELNAIEKWPLNIRFLPPVSYKQSIWYQKFAQAIITDSGGIQKEAYWLQKRCITLRKETEWTETLSNNWNKLAYNDLSKIPEFLNSSVGPHDPALYGDGVAATHIVNHLAHLL